MRDAHAHALTPPRTLRTRDRYNAKCNNSVDGLCLVNESSLSPPILGLQKFALETLGWRNVPLVQVCCVCIMNATYDWSDAMTAMVDAAKVNNYSGYALDFECGNAHYDPKRRAKFLTEFGDAMHAIGDDVTLSFFDHIG